MRNFTLLLLMFITINLNAQRYDFEQVSVPGVENPVYIALSPNGLKMVIIDQPRRGFPQVKFANRPYLESRWGAAYPIDAINQRIDKDTKVDGFVFTFDNKFIYFSANFSDTFGGADIYKCQINGDQLSEPINIGKPINTEANEGFPSVSGNNRELFFTREITIRRLESFKTGEVWSSYIDDETNTWGEPQKLNKLINDGGIAWPKIYDDNQTLYFSRIVDSKDKWKINWASRYTDLHWYIPVPFDTLSSKRSEISPFFCKQDGFLYYIVYDDSGFNPVGTIYRYKTESQHHTRKTIEIKGRVVDKNSKQPVKALVLVTDPVLGKRHFFTQSDEANGNWRTLINSGNNNMFQVWKDNYSHVYRLFDRAETQSNSEYNIELFNTINLTLNIYDTEAYWPLNGIIKTKSNISQSVEIRPIKTDEGEFNLNLSIGQEYTFDISVKDYEPQTFIVDLSNIVLFDQFVRDVELVPLKRKIDIKIFDEETQEPLNANVELIDRRGNVLIPKVLENTTGLYEITLREGERFDIEVKGVTGFAFKHINFDLDADRQLKQIDIPLSPLTRKVPIVLNNINFEFNAADLLESSFVELNRVLQLLKDNPGIHMEIMAHTDDIGSDRYNDALATKRAQSVVEYLIVNGINQNRLKATGFGKKMPLVPNISEANRAINRRVEMRVFDHDDKEFFIEERINQ
jgi:outer membrane protein OmpA-like peptidoglycan-associated protein